MVYIKDKIISELLIACSTILFAFSWITCSFYIGLYFYYLSIQGEYKYGNYIILGKFSNSIINIAISIYGIILGWAKHTKWRKAGAGILSFWIIIFSTSSIVLKWFILLIIELII